jgi:hypothetical protein
MLMYMSFNLHRIHVCIYNLQKYFNYTKHTFLGDYIFKISETFFLVISKNIHVHMYASIMYILM